MFFLETKGDVGGQKTLRSYWRNYFEKTDTLIWVVDSTDRFRLGDCATELHGLLQEERLLGASLLVFANKSEVVGGMRVDEIKAVCFFFFLLLPLPLPLPLFQLCFVLHLPFVEYIYIYIYVCMYVFVLLTCYHCECQWQKQGLKLDEIKTHKWTIMQCSAMTGMNLIEGLRWVVEDAKERLFLY